MPIVTLSEMSSGQEADLFLLMTVKEELKTKTGKPYFRVGFRDGAREVSFPIWGDSPWAVDCRDHWTPGVFYKLRATYQETSFGPQLEIRKIREAVDADAADGFDPTLCLPRSRFDPEEMFQELLAIAKQRVGNPALRTLVESLLTSNRDALLTHPAARRNHHAYVGGLLEHTLSVTRTCVFLADKYAEYYPEMKPPLDKDLVVAGGILHDIGKIGIDDAVLKKKGRLSPEEAALMQHHPVKGHEILKGAGFGQATMDAVLYHHERVDGAGYPEGRAGDAIPIAARIVLVADAFDAMTTDRVYRKALPQEAAIQELRRFQDTQFDRRCIDALVQALRLPEA